MLMRSLVTPGNPRLPGEPRARRGLRAWTSDREVADECRQKAALEQPRVQPQDGGQSGARRHRADARRRRWRMVDALRADPDVEYAEPDYVRTAHRRGDDAVRSALRQAVGAADDPRARGVGRTAGRARRRSPSPSSTPATSATPSSPAASSAATTSSATPTTPPTATAATATPPTPATPTTRARRSTARTSPASSPPQTQQRRRRGRRRLELPPASIVRALGVRPRHRRRQRHLRRHPLVGRPARRRRARQRAPGRRSST